jgi:hypothetical protein
MATLDEVEAAFMRAHSAGDRAAAEALAGEVKRMRAGEKKSAPLADDTGFWRTLPIAAGRTVDNVMDGMTQLYLGARGESSALDALKQQNSEKAALYKPLQEARPWATGIGEALPAMAIPVGGSATLLGNAGRMAAAGAIPGALEYGSTGERFQRGVIGGVSGAVVPLLGAASKTAASVLEPLYQRGRETIAGRTLNRVAGDSAKAVRARLTGAAELVSGSAPTAAQVAESGGIAALERSAAASNPEAYSRRAMEQASARLSALRGIAGDDAAMAAAEAARESTSKALYDAADIGIAPIDGMFRGLQMRPQFKAAIDRATVLAKDNGIDDIFFRDSNGKPIALLGQGAHYIKKALDEAGEYGASSYTGKSGAAAANKTNEAFQKWLDASIPEYGAAKAAYESASKPINQMQVGRALLDKAQPALADFGALGRETGATFATAMRNGDATAARATGFPGARMDSVLTPQQFQAVTGVARDLARKANAQDLGRGVGSDTFQKLSMQNIAEQSGMPRLTGGLLDLPGVSRATAWAYRDTDQKMQELLAEALLSPAKAAELMAKADKRWLADNPKTRRLLEQSAVRAGGLLGLASTSSLAEPVE